MRGRWLSSLTWGYAALILVVLGLIRGVGNAWWFGTLLLFMPRWLFFIPLVALAVASGLKRCFWHWVLQGVTAAIVAGPLMGLCVPVQQLWERPPVGERLRVASYNLGLEPIQTGALKRWIEEQNLDVVCFQEGGSDTHKLRPELPEGWILSERSFVATRLPVVATFPQVFYDSESGRRYGGLMERLRLRTPLGREFIVASIHVPTVREGIEGFFSKGDRVGVALHTEWWTNQLSKILTTMSDSGDVPLLIGGDFNMPSDDSTMAALHTSFRFAFEDAGLGYGFTRPSRHPWVRIDHILTDPQWYVAACRVGPDFGSDHLPVFAEVVLSPNLARPVR